MKFLEPLAILAVIAGFLLKSYFPQTSNVLIMSGLFGLSMIYFYFSFAIFNNLGVRAMVKKSSYDEIHQLRLIGAILAGFCLSAIITGVLFKFLSLMGANIMMIAGSSGLLVILVIGFIGMLVSKHPFDYFYKGLFIRGACVLALTVWTITLDPVSVIRFYHADEPEFANVLIDANQHPDDTVKQNHLRHVLDQRSQKKGK